MKNKTSYIISFLFTLIITLFMICIVSDIILSEPFSDSLKENLELNTTDDIVLHDFLVEKANLYDKILGWEVHAVSEYNSIIFLDDDYLATCLPRYSDDTINDLALSISELSYVLSDQNIPLLYIHAPSKVCFEDAADNVLDFSNNNAERFLNQLEEFDIPYIDLHSKFHEITDNHHALYYKTDHHWRAETGLLSAQIICNYLNSNYNFQIDTPLFNDDCFYYDIYENYFLGSQGKKVTLARSAPENITLIYPLGNTSLSLEIPSKDIDVSGSFDIIYDYQQMNNSDLYEFNPYASYLYGDSAYIHLENAGSICNKNLLIIKDSFANSVIPFLSLGIDAIDAVDLRYFSGSFKDFLEQNGYYYDLVIILYSDHSFGEIDYESHTSLWDFN